MAQVIVQRFADHWFVYKASPVGKYGRMRHDFNIFNSFIQFLSFLKVTALRRQTLRNVWGRLPKQNSLQILSIALHILSNIFKYYLYFVLFSYSLSCTEDLGARPETI